MYAVLKTNDLVGGRYQVLHPVATGGMGAVYKVADTRLTGTTWALKLLQLGNLPPADQQELVQLFKKEAEVLAKLRHPAIPVIIDYFSENQQFMLVMDFVEGQTLESIHEETLTKKQAFSVDEVRAIGLKLCEVLEYLHSQQPAVLYRDMKPANVMRRTDGQLILIDFGLAGCIRQTQLHGGQTQQPGTGLFGSPGYAAPEQYAPNLPTDQRTDVFGVGATLHQLLTNQDPRGKAFMFSSAKKLRPDAPDDLCNTIMKAIEMTPEDRFQSIAEFRTALEGFAPAPAKTIGTSTLVDAEFVKICQSVNFPSPQRRNWLDNWVDDPGRRARSRLLRQLVQHANQNLLEEALDCAKTLTQQLEKDQRSEEQALRAPLYFLLAKLYEAHGDLADAQRNYELATSCDVQLTVAYKGLARVKQIRRQAAKQRQANQQAQQQAAIASRQAWINDQFDVDHLHRLFIGDHGYILCLSWLVTTLLTCSIYGDTSATTLGVFLSPLFMLASVQLIVHGDTTDNEFIAVLSVISAIFTGIVTFALLIGVATGEIHSKAVEPDFGVRGTTYVLHLPQKWPEADVDVLRDYLAIARDAIANEVQAEAPDPTTNVSPTSSPR